MVRQEIDKLTGSSRNTRRLDEVEFSKFEVVGGLNRKLRALIGGIFITSSR